MNAIDIPDNTEWYTEISHPASRLAHQMAEVEGVLYGRVTQNGREIVSPSTNPDGTYKQYRGRVERWISEDEILSAQETASDRATWYDMDR